MSYKYYYSKKKIQNDTIKIEEYQVLVNLLLKGNDINSIDFNKLKEKYKIEKKNKDHILLIVEEKYIDFYGFELYYEKNKLSKIYYYKP